MLAGLLLRVATRVVKPAVAPDTPTVLAGWVTSVVTTTLPDAMEVMLT